MTICRVHLSTALLFSKFHLHASLVIKVINTMESPVHPNNFRERKQTVQRRSKENKYSHQSPFCFFFYSFSFLCLFMYSCIHPKSRFLIVLLAPFVVKSFSALQRTNADAADAALAPHLWSALPTGNPTVILSHSSSPNRRLKDLPLEIKFRGQKSS